MLQSTANAVREVLPLDGNCFGGLLFTRGNTEIHSSKCGGTSVEERCCKRMCLCAGDWRPRPHALLDSGGTAISALMSPVLQGSALWRALIQPARSSISTEPPSAWRSFRECAWRFVRKGLKGFSHTCREFSSPEGGPMR
jgi:hypothetical protein